MSHLVSRKSGAILVFTAMFCAASPATAELNPGIVFSPERRTGESLLTHQGNFDDDPFLEYVVVTDESGLLYLDVYDSIEGARVVPSSRTFLPQTGVSKIAVADCDLDGDDDLAIAIPGAGFDIYRAQGDGSFSFLTTQDPTLFDSGGSAVAADIQAIDWLDMDDDGFVDLLVGFEKPVGSINKSQLWWNFGLVGTAQTNQGCAFSDGPVTIDGESYGDWESWGVGHTGDVYAFHTFDFNRDGWEDVAVGTDYYTYVYVGESNPDPNDPTTWFLQKTIHGDMGAGYAYYDLESGDFDRDGLLDLFAVGYIDDNNNTGQASLFLANLGASALFDPPIMFNTPTDYVADMIEDELRIHVGDVNMDGWLDVTVITVFPDIFPVRQVRVLYNRGPIGAPGFVDSDGEYLSGSDEGRGLASELVDFDGDGDLDMLLDGWFYSPDYGPAYYESFPPEGFARRKRFNVFGTRARAISSGDFNDDGRDEIIYSEGSDIERYASISTFPSPVASGTARFELVDLVDLNSDGRLDVAAWDGAGAQIGAYFQQADGSFTFGFSEVVGTLAEMHWRDVNQDGQLDAVLATTTRVEFWRGLDVPPYLNSVGPIFGQPARIAMADFDGDGDFDVLASSSSGNFLIENKFGAFDPPTPLASLPGVYSSLTACDIDNDGDVDLAGTLSADPARVYYNDGTGVNWTFTGTAGSGADQFSDVVCGDFDNDGFNDLYFASGTPTTQSVYWPSINGNLLAINQRVVSAGVQPLVAIAAGDFDGDSDLDLFQSANVINEERAWKENPTIVHDHFNQRTVAIHLKVGGQQSGEFTRSGVFHEGPYVPVQIELEHPVARRVPKVSLEFSKLGKGDWRPLDIRQPERLDDIELVNGRANINVEWALPTGLPGDYLWSSDVHIRAKVMQPHPLYRSYRLLAEPVIVVSAPFAVYDPCSGVACPMGSQCFFGSCYTSCRFAADCPGGTCYQQQGKCNVSGTACTIDLECPGAELCIAPPGRCDAIGDPTSSLTCPSNMVPYAGSCYDPCASSDDCTPPQACYNGFCQSDACSGVFCPLGEVCYQGSCWSTVCADDGDCTPPQLCFDNHCETDPCAGVSCPLGQVCFEGSCYDPCASEACEAPNVCYDDRCYDPADPCAGVVCGTTELCVGGSCAVQCMTDAQCASYSIAADGTPLDCDGFGTDDPDCLKCFNGRCLGPADPCDSVYCPLGQTCHFGSCYDTCVSNVQCNGDACYDDTGDSDDPICLSSADPCDSVSCPDEYVCHAGSCYVACGSASACMTDADCADPEESCQNGYCIRCNPESEVCYQNYCAPSACDSVYCPLGEVCYAGSCFEPCITASCTAFVDSCFGGRCAEENCDDVICPLGEVCAGGECFAPCDEQSDCATVGIADWFFFDVTNASGLKVLGAKEGGASWHDFDNDGDLDVAVNTVDGTINSRLFRNNGDKTFADVTFFGYANWMGRVNADRSVVWGDYNGDGYVDLARNSGRRVEIFANKGPTGSPPYGLGVGPGAEPNQEFRSWPLGGTFNTEGMAWIDYDGDGDLDLMVNSQEDIVLLENVGGTLRQSALPSAHGLLTGASASDYCLTADLDVDGDVDIVCRVDGTGSARTTDIWFNLGGGIFTPVASPDIKAENANKGGVAACDLTNNGLLDIVWTDGASTVILRHRTPGDFQETTQLEISSMTVLPADIDGVDCGDVDNDGDLDIVLAGASQPFLFLNESSGSVLLFRNDRKNLGSVKDIESVNLVDFDLDGDLDVFLNEDDTTRLYESNLDTDNFIRIRAVYDRGMQVSDALGATIVVRDPDGAILGAREISGGKGHGSQGSFLVNYGLPYGRAVPYQFDVQFPNGDTVSKCVVPAAMGATLVIRNTDSDDVRPCAVPDWEDDKVVLSAPGICWAPVLDDAGNVERPAHCAGSACEGVQCPGDEICFEGGCFDFCTGDLECDPGSICFNNRCVEETNPYCDGIVCPLGDVCYRGECFGGCGTDSDCPTGDFCYLGRCAPEDCGGIGSLCESDEVCYRGTCYEDCASDPSVCPPSEECFEGRCAANGCAALTDTYNTDHPYRSFGRRLGSSQYSTPWYIPRPVVTSAPDFASFARVSAGVETNEVPARSRARVAVVLDPSLADGANPKGRYVLYLTQGFDSGLGTQKPTIGQYNIRVRRNDEVAKVVWENQAEAYHGQSDGDEQLWVVRLTSDTDQTAGIAIGPFASRDAVDYSITIQAALGGDIKDWEFYNPDDGGGFVLRQDEPLKIRSVPLNPDLYLTPSSGMPCDVDPSIAQGMCGIGTSSCGFDGSLVCDQTIIRWPYELCDGRDNNCNGSVDENIRFPAVDWRQGSGGWSFFVTNDTLSDVHNFMNFKPRATDDRRGSTALVGYAGLGIQGPKKSVVTMHRDIRTGMLAMPMVHGLYMSGVLAEAFNEQDIYMTLGLDPAHPDNTFIAFHDDALPVPTNDEIPDSYDALTKEVGLDWRLAKASSSERESDSIAVRPLVRPWDRFPQVTFSVEFEGALGATNSEASPEQLEWRLYQPRLAENNLRRADDLQVRTTLRPTLTSVCAASNVSPSGCTLGRYQCVRGRTFCSSATDGACDLCFDSDGDGFERYDAATCPDGTDCNDSNPLVYPGAEEICDGFDNDCDGETDLTLDGAVAFGETLSCGNGDARCGPAECGYAFSCTCPDGPEDPTDPSSGICFCASSLDAPGEVAAPVEAAENRVDGLDDDVPSAPNESAQMSSGCATPGGDAAPMSVLMFAIGLWFLRRRR